jgi:hypothetical protein
MAGQPQDPSWQPGAQDQARAAWPPQPSFTPPPPGPPLGAPAGPSQETFAYPQPSVYGQPGHPGPPQGQPGQGYPPPTYTPPGMQDQGQAYGLQDQGQGMPQWQATPGMPPRSAQPRPRGEKGFVGSLFDFSFQSMVTPKIIKMLYVLLTLFVGLWALIFTFYCFKHAGAVGGFFVLIVLDPIYVLLTLGVYRVVLEFVMVTFRLHEDVQAIRAKAEKLD